MLDVVGIGADGWEGLPPAARALVESAEVVLGGARHLAMLPASVYAQRVPWPSPLMPELPGLIEEFSQHRLVVLASGDPMLSGIGSTLVELLGLPRVRVHPTVSSVALACARMGWSAESVDVVTVVGRDLAALRRLLQSRRRLVVLGSTPAEIAALLEDSSCAASRVTVLANLGAPTEAIAELAPFAAEPAPFGAELAPFGAELAVVCVEVAGEGFPVTPGLPDDAFEHDGQLTKRDLRASALARLAPGPGQLLWDVGAGAGSIAIEWMRSDARAQAVAIESNPERVQRIRRNAARLGVPSLSVVKARAPEGFDELPMPDAIFVGGGASREGVLETCWDALVPGGRLVVHAVTLETEQVVFDNYRKHGGELTRLSVDHANAIGSFTGWTPARPVTQWTVTK